MQALRVRPGDQGLRAGRQKPSVGQFVIHLANSGLPYRIIFRWRTLVNGAVLYLAQHGRSRPSS